ncbi:class I SAM-dependent methyltransferase [Luteolibacter arcticus]|uniref:Class I SAM-dependent methyltransferase n=1 Tax=Luteolibacter arcticus TaxID=1581411 RepID=A0ABT3GJ57_9BACT|nr:class I SAM-dependent methyltransferase [Luteolibacter arcticus]MCW1923516.1 class I SAM-dependent methyltransferase [Luteolibacter arcticus]
MTAIDIYRRVFKIWRARRFEQFVRLLAPSRGDSLIDIGGELGFWTSYPPVVGSIDLVNPKVMQIDSAAHPEHAQRTIVGDGRHLVDVGDQSYDIAFSNSVIEHVGTWEDQQKFAAESRRVGKKLWCQTPARECPIEPHYMAPFIHWLPRSLQRRLMRRFTPWGWLSKPTKADIDFMVDTTRLLTFREMKQLFPDCQILVERILLVFPKSYIAVRTEAPAPTTETPRG